MDAGPNKFGGADGIRFKLLEEYLRKTAKYQKPLSLADSCIVPRWPSKALWTPTKYPNLATVGNSAICLAVCCQPAPTGGFFLWFHLAVQFTAEDAEDIVQPRWEGYALS